MSEEENGKSRRTYHFPRVRKGKSENASQQELADTNEMRNSGSNPPISNSIATEFSGNKNDSSVEINNSSTIKEEVEEATETPKISSSPANDGKQTNSDDLPDLSSKIERNLDEEQPGDAKVYHFPRVRKGTREIDSNKLVSYSNNVPKFEEKRLFRSLMQQKRSLLIETAVVIAIALILILLVPPFLSIIGQGFRINLLGRFLALAIVALGIDLIWGYTGMLSLGHGVFFALGGYALAMHLKLQIPPDASIQLPEFMSLYGVTELPWFWQPFYSFPVAAIAIILIPSVLGAILGYLVFRNRIKGVYFSILTQAATIVFFNFFNGQQKLFNGTNGLTDFKTLLGFKVNENQIQFVFYTLTVLLLAGAYALCRWLTTGRFGRLLIAIRDDEARVRFSGYDPTGYKVLVFAISAGLAGIAGAMFTVQTGLISPKAMDIAASIEMVIWVAVGGRASLVGAVLGAIAVNFGKSILSEQFPEVWLFFQGALFLIVVTVLPDGVVGWFRTEGIEKVRSLLGFRKYAVTYPSLEENPEILREREELEAGE